MTRSVGAAMVLLVGLKQDFSKSGKIGFVLVGNNKLIRVRPAIRRTAMASPP